MIASEEAARTWLGEHLIDDAAVWTRLELLIARLKEENTRQNLVSRMTLDHVWQRHICDSAQLLIHVPRGTIYRWLDLGTGAGFPGLVVATLRPDLGVTMVESRARRVEWLTRVAEELGLSNTTVLGTQLQRIESSNFDVISARAFAPLGSLVAWAARFSTQSTLWVLPKGRSAAQELSELQGWRHTFHVEHSLTDPDAGIVVGYLAGPERR
jgi:16S rRNA (guanine527-N7)-methyltransferase